MSITRWLAALFAALLLLTGCNEDGADESDAETTSETTEAGESDSPATEETDAGEVALPEGHQWVVAEESGIRFAAPGDWSVVGPEVLDNPGSQAEIDELTRRSGIPRATFEQILQNVDAYVISPAGESINVQQPGVLAALPTDAQIEGDFGSLGATVTSIDDVETPIGPGRVVFYDLPLSTGEQQYGASLFVDTESAGIVNLTGAMWDATEATQVTGTASATLSYVEE